MATRFGLCGLVLAGLVVSSGCTRDYLFGSTGPMPSAPAPVASTCPGPGERAAREQIQAVSHTPQRARVERVGQQLLVANPQLGLRPAFSVTGIAEPSISHTGSQQVTISEGMVNACQTDAQLAAVLSFELARMSSARRSHAKGFDAARDTEPMPVIQFGRDGGSIGESEQYYKAELAKLGYDRPRKIHGIDPGDPAQVARQLLTRAGYAERELDGVVPLIQAAHPPRPLK